MCKLYTVQGYLEGGGEITREGKTETRLSVCHVLHLRAPGREATGQKEVQQLLGSHGGDLLG